MAFEAGLSRSWYNKGAKAARSGRHRDMYSAWHSAKSKPATMGTRITAQESFYQGYIDNVGRHNPTKSKAVSKLLRKVNPGRKLPAAVRIKKLAGGGFSVTPVKVKRNAGPLSFRKVKKSSKKFQRLGMLEPGPAFRKWRRVIKTSKSKRRGNIAW